MTKELENACSSGQREKIAASLDNGDSMQAGQLWQTCKGIIADQNPLFQKLGEDSRKKLREEMVFGHDELLAESIPAIWSAYKTQLEAMTSIKSMQQPNPQCTLKETESRRSTGSSTTFYPYLDIVVDCPSESQQRIELLPTRPSRPPR